MCRIKVAIKVAVWTLCDDIRKLCGHIVPKSVKPVFSNFTSVTQGRFLRFYLDS